MLPFTIQLRNGTSIGGIPRPGKPMLIEVRGAPLLMGVRLRNKDGSWPPASARVPALPPGYKP